MTGKRSTAHSHMRDVPTVEPRSREQRVAVVTGASSGVGRAIALALGHAGFSLHIMGRDVERLATTAADARQFTTVQVHESDLANDESLNGLAEALNGSLVKLDVLVHAAGTIHQGHLEQATAEQFDEQYRTNIRAPYLLTKRLSRLLIHTRGQIVFLNSSVGLTVNRPEIAQYAATKHALKGLADSLRAELNPKGVRVLSLFLGRTATAMQKKLCEQNQLPYRPSTLLQPEDVATIVLAALALPMTAEVTDISIRPMTPP